MKKKFWETYREWVQPEAIVGMWFVTPMVTLFLTNDGGLTLVMTMVVVAITNWLEIGYSEYIRNK